MDNQHRKIVGYRELTEEDIDLMNEIKSKTKQLLALVGVVRARVDNQYQQVLEGNDDEARDRLFTHLEVADPGSWVSEAEMALKKGCMYLVRAVAQPTDC